MAAYISDRINVDFATGENEKCPLIAQFASNDLRRPTKASSRDGGDISRIVILLTRRNLGIG